MTLFSLRLNVASAFFFLVRRKVRQSSDDSLRVVTGADSSHFHSLKNLLSSAAACRDVTFVTVYDLGLSDSEESELRQMVSQNEGWELKKFEFGNHPDYYDIKKNAGEYAWKPELFRTELENNRGERFLLWLDAGDILPSSITRVLVAMVLFGLWSPTSKGKIERWTHKNSRAKFGDNKDLRMTPNRSGAIVGLDTGYSVGVCAIQWWALAAADKRWIAPEGSSRANHRQDQAIFSMICKRLGIAVPPLGNLGIRIHQDSSHDKN